MNSNIFKAILSMDAYNRGYNAQIKFGDAPGDYSLDTAGTQLGNAAIYKNIGNEDAQDIGFYGLAYQVKDENGNVIDTVISYRGTDQLPDSMNPFTWDDDDTPDIANGWNLGLGYTATGSQQGKMAVQFYKSIAEELYPSGANVYQDADISLTGHSLGGGLGGYVAAIYGQNAKLFDAMPFLYAVNETELDIANDDDAALKTLLYGSATPWSVNYDGIGGSYLSGEALAVARSDLFLSSPVPEFQTENSIYDEVGEFDSFLNFSLTELHSVSSLIIRMYADDATKVADADWQYAAPFIWPYLYKDTFAFEIGADSVAGQLNTDGKHAEILRSVIAYSAIDEGVRPFGDTAIRALYHDMDQLGEAVQGGGLASTFSPHLEDIAKASVYFAGLSALEKVQEGNTPYVANGILEYSDADKTPSINFEDALWAAANGGTGSVAGRQSDLLSPLLTATGIENDIRNHMYNLWGNNSTNVFERAVFITQENTQTTLSGGYGFYHIFVVGTSADDTITTGYDNNLVLAGDGNDVISTSYGIDIIYGGAGNDTIEANTGDTIYGGDDWDTIKLDSGANGFIEYHNYNFTLHGAKGIRFSAYDVEEIDHSALSNPKQNLIYLMGNVSSGLVNYTGLNNGVVEGYNDIAQVDYSQSVSSLTISASNGFVDVNTPEFNHDYVSGNWNQTLDMYGSVYGDTVTGVNDYFRFHGGRGDDQITLDVNAYMGHERALMYRGGNDLIDLNKSSSGLWIDISEEFSSQDVSSATKTYIGNYDAGSGNIRDLYEYIITFDADNSLTITNVQDLSHSDRVFFYFEADKEKGVFDNGQWTLESYIHNPFSNRDVYSNSIYGSWVNDVYTRVNGSDTYYALAGDDTFNGNALNDRAYMGLGDDVAWGHEGNDDLLGGEGNDILHGGNGNDFIEGGAGNDNLWGEEGDDTLRGGDGDDWLYSGSGTNTLWGEGGDDLYFIASDNQYTSIRDGQGHNKIYIEGYLETDLQYSDGYALTISYNNNDIIYVQFPTEDLELHFDSGLYYTVDDLRNWDGYAPAIATSHSDNITLSTYDTWHPLYLGSGDDTYTYISTDDGGDIYGDSGNDTLISYGGGNFYGGDGDDKIYVSYDHSNGYSVDVTGGQGNDVFGLSSQIAYIILKDFVHGEDKIDLSNLQHIYDINDLTILDYEKDSIIDLGSNGYIDVANQKFDTWTADDFIFRDPTVTEGTSDDDVLIGTYRDESIFGYNGNDTLFGNGGDDYLYGGDGIDFLHGGNGMDLLEGGHGNDFFDFQPGDNHDTIIDFARGEDKIHLLSFTSVMTLADLTYYTGGSDTVFDFGGDSLRVANHDASSWVDSDFYFNGIYGDEDSNFISGTTAAERIYGMGGNDYLQANGDGDILTGGDGYEYFTIGGGAGNDTITDFTHWDDRIDVYYLAGVEDYADITLLQQGDDVQISFAGYAGTVTIWNSSVSNWSEADFVFAPVHGTNGDDYLYGTNGDDTIYGEGGSDVIYGYGGYDWIFGNDQQDWVHGGDQDDFVFGNAGDDRVYGEDGDDKLHGDAGVDYLWGGEGNDTLRGGADDDALRGEQGDDIIYGGDGNDHIRGDDADATPGWAGSGNDYMYGEAGNDNIQGGDGDDFLNGGIGVDVLTGGAGIDTFHYDYADLDGSRDYIMDFTSGVGGDVLDLSNVIDFDPVNDTLSDFVSIATGGSYTRINVDYDGTGTAHSVKAVAQLQGVTGLNLTDLVNDGNLIVA